MQALGSGSPPRTEIPTAHFGGSEFDFMGAIVVFPDYSLPNRDWSCTHLSGSVITQASSPTPWPDVNNSCVPFTG